MSTIGVIIVNFGGPRDLVEVEPFLVSLLTDEDVIRTPLPSWIQRRFFRSIAKKRAKRVANEYAKIGGKSPIFEDTQWVVDQLKNNLGVPVIGFHRYLESTHNQFLEELSSFKDTQWVVFPLFPQFSYVTAGSVARWFKENIDKKILANIRWIRSYPTQQDYIDAFAHIIREMIEENDLHDATLFFSAHGLPVKYIKDGDPYQKECEASYEALRSLFSSHPSLLAYQSQFGRAQWLGPATKDICESPDGFLDKQRSVLFIPLSFSSDHIETLFEVEEYRQELADAGFRAYRCPALGREPKWLEAIKKIVETSSVVETATLIR